MLANVVFDTAQRDLGGGSREFSADICGGYGNDDVSALPGVGSTLKRIGERVEGEGHTPGATARATLGARLVRFGYRLLPPVVVSATRSNVDEAFARGVSVALDAGMKLTAELSLVGSFSYAWAERHRFIDADIERQEVLLRLGLKCVPAALF